MQNKTVDARGMACPLPVVNAKKASEEMTEGGVLTVLVDNEIAVQNLTKFAASRGFQSSAEKKGKRFRCNLSDSRERCTDCCFSAHSLI